MVGKKESLSGFNQKSGRLFDAFVLRMTRRRKILAGKKGFALLAPYF